jgi:selenide,water dikinase
VLGQLPDITDPNVLVGTANADDAGVYKLTDDIAVVFTADFFTPIVDDPYWFGAIAAANALSDVWAMGGKALVALNLASFPPKADFLPALKEVMRGGIEKMTEAGVSIIGGHTIKDKEPKYGFAVLGLIHPDRILDNSMAKPGDAMVLTKKIGTGIVATGIKAQMCDEAVIRELSDSMAALNRRPSEIMLEVGVNTATDITGFGLIGHIYEVLKASGVRARLRSSHVPYFDEGVKIAESDIVPGGTIDNFKIFSPYVRYAEDVPDHEQILMNDAQTSGGLVIFVPNDKKDTLIERLRSEGIVAAHIGDVTDEKISDEERVVMLVERG